MSARNYSKGGIHGAKNCKAVSSKDSRKIENSGHLVISEATREEGTSGKDVIQGNYRWSGTAR